MARNGYPNEMDDLQETRRLADVFREPGDAANAAALTAKAVSMQASISTSSARRPPVPSRRAWRLAVGTLAAVAGTGTAKVVAGIGAVTLMTGGLAAADVLPDSLQHRVSEIARIVGIDLPDPEDGDDLITEDVEDNDARDVDAHDDAVEDRLIGTERDGIEHDGAESDDADDADYARTDPVEEKDSAEPVETTPTITASDDVPAAGVGPSGAGSDTSDVVKGVDDRKAAESKVVEDGTEVDVDDEVEVQLDVGGDDGVEDDDGGEDDDDEEDDDDDDEEEEDDD